MGVEEEEERGKEVKDLCVLQILDSGVYQMGDQRLIVPFWPPEYKSVINCVELHQIQNILYAARESATVIRRAMQH